MMLIIELSVFGFLGGEIYRVGENGINFIKKLSDNSGYCIFYDDGKIINITGYFQFVSIEKG